jgi:hypothetical protein
VLALAVGPASAASINVSPSNVAPGGTFTLSGDVLAGGTPGCQVPGTVTLISNAFLGLGEFAGTPAVDVPVDATGHFSIGLKLDVSAPAGTHTITGRCGGGNLGVEGSITVTSLAATGPAVPVAPMVAASAVAILGGLLTLTAARRRRAASLLIPVRVREGGAARTGRR